MVEDVKVIKIPMDRFKKILRELNEVDIVDCYDYKHYHEGLASVMDKLRPFLGDIEDKPSKTYKTLNENVYKYAMEHDDEKQKILDEYEYGPYCHGDDYDCDGDCDDCEFCYEDDIDEDDVETKFVKLLDDFEDAFQQEHITESERDELICRWNHVRENYCLWF